jgi:hypothetical protein
MIPGFVAGGGAVLGIGLDDKEIAEGLKLPIEVKSDEYINAPFTPSPAGSAFAGIGPADLQNSDPRTIALSNGGVLAASKDNRLLLFQLAPWTFDVNQLNTRRVFRRASFALSRVLGNLGVHARTPLLDRFASPATAGEQRWLTGLYLDKPIDWDDPYRFFRW